jgi:hypothetical protein
MGSVAGSGGYFVTMGADVVVAAPATITDLQQLLDRYRTHYNHQRRHSALPGRATPQQAWTTAASLGGPDSLPIQTDATLHRCTVAANGDETIGNILAETGLRLIGLGPGDLVTLGLMLNWAVNLGALAQGWYQMVLGPAGALIMIFVSLSLINVGIEERFNPRLKGVTGR